MVDREKLREILRRADAKHTTASPSAPDDARERRRQALERAGLVEPRQPKTEQPPKSQAVEAIPAPQAPALSPQDVVLTAGSGEYPLLTAEEMRALQEALGLPPTEGPEELSERDFLEREGDDVEPIEPPPVPEDVIKNEIKRRVVELSARYKDVEEIISGLRQDERMKPYLEEFNRRAGKLLERLEDKLRKAERTGVIATQQQLVKEFNGIFENFLGKLISDHISKCEADQKNAVAAESHGDDAEVELSREGGELLEFMRTTLADLPNPFERMEAGELNYSFANKQKEIERRVAKIAAEVLKKFGAANGDKLKELEAIVHQITDELLDRNEAAAVFYLVDVLGRGRNGFDVVLDEERMLEARNRLFQRGEVSPLSAGRSDFEALDDKLLWQSITAVSKLLEGTAGDKDKQFLRKYDSLISPESMKRNYNLLLSEGKVLRCLAMLAFVKDRNKVAVVCPPDLLSFETNPDFKQKFEELYRGAIQRLSDKIKSGEVKIDTSDDKAVKEALRPYSDFAVANGALGFDWKRLREKYGVS